MNEKRVRSDRYCPYFEIRALVALFLCAVLFTGCASVRPGVVAGEFGPLWQAREAAYVQEEEEDDDDFGDRMEGADRKSNRKRGWTMVFLGAFALAALASLIDDVESEEELTFDAPLDDESSHHESASFRVRPSG